MKTNRFLLAVAVATMAFTFSCSSDDGEKEDGGEQSSPSGGGEQSSPSGGGGSSSSVVSGGDLSSSGGGVVIPTPTITTFIDSRDSTTYNKVTIGTQTWMAENLNYNANGSKCYGDDTGGDSRSYCVKYGRLYNWDTAMNNSASSDAVPSGVQGVCPDGWHLPSRAEWNMLTTAVGGGKTAGTKLKAAIGWNDPAGTSGSNGTDDYGFSALPGGLAEPGSFGSVGYRGYWWSATRYPKTGEESAYGLFMQSEYSNVNSITDNNSMDGHDKTDLYSVRCVKDTP